MGFFDDLPPGLPEPWPADGPWRRPEHEFPRVALSGLLLAQTEAVAVAVTAVWAFSTGFELWIGSLFRQKGVALEEESDGQALHIGLQYADGRKIGDVAALAGAARSAAGNLLLRTTSFGGGLWQKRRAYWVWPLPPPGPLAFVCEWARFGIPEQRTVTDGRLILDAARLSHQMWPEGDA